MRVAGKGPRVVLVALLAIVAGGAARGTGTTEAIDASGVVRLLDVMDAIAERHRGAVKTRQALERAAPERRAGIVADAREANEGDAAVGSAIRRLLETETYNVYFRRFPNVTRERFTALLLELPYGSSPAPGDLGTTLRDLFWSRERTRAGLDKLLAAADPVAIHARAARFAPGWDGSPPTLRLIYDSNAGSFAAEGSAFFNVFTGVDLVALGESTEADALRGAQGVMAHELNHVLVEPALYPQTDEVPSMRARWVGQLTRGAVGEGVANLCGPPTGPLREVYEDPDVLAGLAADFSAVIGALLAGEMDDDGMRAWYRANYFDSAVDLLRLHLAKKRPEADLEAAVRESMRFRPDFEHAFGWWMVSRVWERDPREQVVARLLENPVSVYRAYHETLDVGQESLRIAPEVVEAMERLFTVRSAETDG